MPTLTIAPNPAAPGDRLTILGVGFARYETRMYLDGTLVDDVRPDKNGAFDCGATATTTPKTQTLAAKQKGSGLTWLTVATASLLVQVAAPPPPPPPPPPPTGTTLTVAPGASAATFLAMLQQNCDAIEFAGPFYPWEDVEIDVDRTTQPVVLRRAPGVAQVAFPGNGATSAGIFFIGLHGLTKHIAFDGLGPFTPALAQAGCIELRSGDYIDFQNMIFNPSRDQARLNSAPFKSFGIYASGQGRNLDHITGDHLTFLRPKIARDVSGIQVASSSLRSGSIHFTNVTMDGYCYGFYCEVPVDDLILDQWTVTDTGIAIPGHTPSSINFQAFDIKGKFSNIHAVNSGPLRNLSTGPMVDGGGNSFA